MVYVQLEQEWVDGTGTGHAAGDMVDVDAATLAELESQGIVAGPKEPDEWAGPGAPPVGDGAKSWAGPGAPPVDGAARSWAGPGAPPVGDGARSWAGPGSAER